MISPEYREKSFGSRSSVWKGVAYRPPGSWPYSGTTCTCSGHRPHIRQPDRTRGAPADRTRPIQTRCCLAGFSCATDPDDRGSGRIDCHVMRSRTAVGSALPQTPGLMNQPIAARLRTGCRPGHSHHRVDGHFRIPVKRHDGLQSIMRARYRIAPEMPTDTYMAGRRSVRSGQPVSRSTRNRRQPHRSAPFTRDDRDNDTCRRFLSCWRSARLLKEE